MRLFIAEKPALALAIASALGSVKKDDGCYIVEDNFVTWCFGHILQNSQPEDYDKKFAKWNLDDLPILPQSWTLQIKADTKKQFYVIKNLIKKADEIVHAGDPDREGQLLVDELLDFLDNKKPVKRIFLNALDDKSVKFALQNLQDNKKFSPLRDSALGRSRADWLIGMNLSRAYSIFSQRQGQENISVGRVMTPTMTLVVRRDDEIKNFVATKHFAINADFDFNDKKISAHHAIIPTTVPVDWKKLDDVQQKLYILVAKKYLAQFFPPHKFLSTKIVIDFADEKFSATGKNILELGWKIIFQTADDNGETVLPKLSDADELIFLDAKIKAIYAVKLLPPELTFPDVAFFQKQLADLNNSVQNVKIEVEKLPPLQKIKLHFVLN